ncbi:hypothetical protein EW146_g10381 [Bondarzewia mesenterica]|uniref:BTB domain-containing protein n=1 Tax=Bondarzewia mesenterica TaxID=1095465 RepID=A0A4S4L2C8_9AGAM|nr:hypothetical protein EW146_g10381 [Bondarzewia mesenterica]
MAREWAHGSDFDTDINVESVAGKSSGDMTAVRSADIIRHPDHYFVVRWISSGIGVEGTLFFVFASTLTRHSRYFHHLLVLQSSSGYDLKDIGKSNDAPLALDDVSCIDLERLLWILYPPYIFSHPSSDSNRAGENASATDTSAHIGRAMQSNGRLSSIFQFCGLSLTSALSPSNHCKPSPWTLSTRSSYLTNTRSAPDGRWTLISSSASEGAVEYERGETFWVGDGYEGHASERTDSQEGKSVGVWWRSEGFGFGRG